MAVVGQQAGQCQAATAGAGGSPVWPGDAVEVFGLSSEAGGKLNGCRGIATKRIPGTDRFEVRLAADWRVNVKESNLRVVQDDPCATVGKLGFGDADRAAKEQEEELINQAVGKFGFKPNDVVEIFGLASEAGKELNGKSGLVMNVAEGGDRLEVRVILERAVNGREKKAKVVNLKPGCLRRPGEEPRDMAPEPLGKVDLGVKADQAQADKSLPLQPGEIVEVVGLQSEAGKQLNGQHGVVLDFHRAEERAEVRLAAGSKKLKFENLVKMDWASGDRVLVEVCGLESETGKQANGQRGFIRDRDPETGRYDVRISKDKILKLKPENLRLITNEA
eukprot:CAMPEP_0197898908 /NCGR_PEP_ID=MMETSP1439-20131203/45176_1 /TAXON_ID=66791 /ORGANISM="Gonyaulax spinifera, Strain CCMP409" /LENGTH=333 /DNA_ID=CAMNT_0043519665 /DNA_START=56 /DNA_END=1057 /DNA_ORIENTATION=+